MKMRRNSFLLILALLILLFSVSCVPYSSEQTAPPSSGANGNASEVKAEPAPENISEAPQNVNDGSPEPGGAETAPPDEGRLPDRQPDQNSQPETETTMPTPQTPEPTPVPTPEPVEIPAETTEASPAPSATPPPDEPIILTIHGDGVEGETTWTLSQLQALQEGYREYVYSATNNWPRFSHASANGVSIQYLLRQSGLLSSAAGFKLTASDGYHVTVTYDQMFGARYAYGNHSSNGSSGASAIEPIVAWEWGDDGRARPEPLRSFFGQKGPMEVNTSAFVKNLNQIEVLTASPGSWAAPGVSIADGSVVASYTELDFLHDTLDSVRIHYTLDGSEPDYSSPVYNVSTSYFQPDLIKPIVLAESVTVKAFATGLGRDQSQIVTFSYTVE